MSLGKIFKTFNLEIIEIALAEKKRTLNKDENFFTPIRTLESSILKLSLLITVIFVFANTSLHIPIHIILRYKRIKTNSTIVFITNKVSRFLRSTTKFKCAKYFF